MRKMNRPLQLEFAGAHHNISSRGNNNYQVYFQVDNFELFL